MLAASDVAGTNTAFRGVGVVAPIPEPASLLLVGAVGVGAVAARRRYPASPRFRWR